MAKKPEAQDEVEALVTAYPVTSANVGTALVTGAGTISSITLAQPTSTAVDMNTQLVLVDAAAAPAAGAPPPRVLFAADLYALASLFEPRPGIALTPGLTAPTWPKSLGVSSISFTKGCFVQSCPANLSFSVSI